MQAILIPIDGTPAAEAAVKAIVAQAQREPVGDIHILNVQRPLGPYVRRFIDRATIRDFQREEVERALAGAKRLLDAAGLRYRAHCRTGPIARTVARAADELRVDEIVIGAEGGGLVANIRLWLLVSAVRRHATVPVLAVMGPARRPMLKLPIGKTRPVATR